MPQFTLVIRWFEIFRIATWWISILVSFHMGQLHGSAKRSVAVVAEKASSDVPKDKSGSGSSEKFGEGAPLGGGGPRAKNHSGDEDPLGGTAPSEVTSSSSGAKVPGGKFLPSEIYMTSTGKVLHVNPVCNYLFTKTQKGKVRKPDLIPTRWCSVCRDSCNQRSKSD